MKSQPILKSRKKRQRASNALLKASSLLYFQEALHKERYEECPGLLQKARDCGAKQSEISEIIARCVRGVTAGRNNGTRTGKFIQKRF